MMDKENAKQQIKELLEKYSRVVEEKRIDKYNEEMTKKDFILPLFRALGWNVENSSEVTAEETISKKRVDYGFRINGIPKFFLEAKPLKADLNDPLFADQAINYAWHKDCTWAVLTDFENIKVFNAEWKTTDLLQSMFFSLDSNQLLERFDQLWLLSKESFEQGLMDKEAEKWGKKSKKSLVGEQLFSDLTKWRSELSKDISQRNKGIKEADLDEAVQRIIDRLIFIRNCEDREMEPPTLLSTMREWDSKRKGSLAENIVRVFKHFDDEYNSKLFQHHLCDDLDVSNQVLEVIIEELYHTKDRTIKYDFAVLDADVLGNVYEQYLGHILKKTAKRATVEEKHAYRKEQGIYYTPTYIVDYIVRNTLGELLKDKKVDVEKIRVLDPACGSGSFLIKAFDVLNEFYSKKEGDHAQTQLDLDTGLPFKQKEKVLLNNIFGVDLDARAVEIAQLNLLLKIAEKKQRLPLLQKNIKCGNSLIDDEKVAGDKAFKWEHGFKQIMDEGGFDVVIGNPPYVRIQTLDKKDVEFFNTKYKSAEKGNYDIYVLFVERALSLLKEGGYIGLILPHKFFTSKYGEPLRKLISEGKYLHEIVHFGDQQVFEGATTYTCLLFLRKKENKKFNLIKVDNLEKWKTEKKAYSGIVDSDRVTSAEWNFAVGEKAALFEKLNKAPLKLGDVADIFVGLQTSADKVFIMNLVEETHKILKLKSKALGTDLVFEKDMFYPLVSGTDVGRYGELPERQYILFPYKVNTSSPTLLGFDEILRNYPMTAAYLLKNKKTLENREGGKFHGSDWYRFGRSQNICIQNRVKICVPRLVNNLHAAYDKEGNHFLDNVDVGGIILKQEYQKQGLTFILGLLNSKLLRWYFPFISAPFRGGWMSANRQFLSQLPIRIIEFSNPKEKETHEQMVKLVDQIISLNKRLNKLGDKKTDERQRIEEEIKKTDAEIDELVYKLYDITESEKKIIEESLK